MVIKAIYVVTGIAVTKITLDKYKTYDKVILRLINERGLMMKKLTDEQLRYLMMGAIVTFHIKNQAASLDESQRLLIMLVLFNKELEDTEPKIIIDKLQDILHKIKHELSENGLADHINSRLLRIKVICEKMSKNTNNETKH